MSVALQPAASTAVRAHWLSVTTAAEIVVLAALLAIALQCRIENVDHFTGSFDEGIRAEQLLLMEHGYRPFTDIFASQGPLLLDAQYPLYAAFGRTLEAARLSVSVFSLIGLLGVWFAGRQTGRWLGGLLVLAILVLSPGYLEGSRLALAEIPSLAPALWAVGCGLIWRRSARRRWLVAMAALGALAVLVKPMAAPVALPLLLLLARPGLRWRDILTAALTAAALSTVVLLWLGAGGVWAVLGQYRGGAAQPALSEAAENWRLTLRLLARERWPLPLLASLGTLIGLLRERAVALALLSWPLATLVMFLAYTDLADKHIVYVIPPLALCAAPIGAAIEDAVRATWSARGRRETLQISPLLLAGLAGLVGVAAAVTQAPELWRTDRFLIRDAWRAEWERRDGPREVRQAEMLLAITAPNDFVLFDNPNAAYRARRLMPPWLVDTSGTRIDAGSLTSALTRRDAERFGAKVVLTWNRRLGKLRDFNQWLDANYRQVDSYGNGEWKLYVRPELESAARSFLQTASQPPAPR